jgi:hypothetical protein
VQREAILGKFEQRKEDLHHLSGLLDLFAGASSAAAGLGCLGGPMADDVAIYGLRRALNMALSSSQAII